jgi:hypothetical protein
LIHLIGFIGGMLLIAGKFASGSLTQFGLIIALTLNLILGLWPVVLQRYNRLRLYRAIYARSRLPHRSGNGVEPWCTRTALWRETHKPERRNEQP